MLAGRKLKIEIYFLITFIRNQNIGFRLVDKYKKKCHSNYRTALLN